MKCVFSVKGLTLIVLTLLVGCNGPGELNDPGTSLLPDIGLTDPVNPGGPDDRSQPNHSIDVLIYNGTGVSTSDWQNTEKIVKAEGWSYRLANASRMNSMSLEELSEFGVIVVPGGKGATITNNLTTAARLRIRRAVQDHGVGYVGFCAGAWVAVGPEADTTRVASYGLAVAQGSVLGSWFPNGNTSLTAAMVPVTFANGSSRYLVWWGGPWTPEWDNGVVARYSNGRPAISQTWSGKGFVVISGPHPEAPQSWRNTAGYDRDGLDYDVAIEMIDSALRKAPLPVY